MMRRRCKRGAAEAVDAVVQGQYFCNINGHLCIQYRCIRSLRWILPPRHPLLMDGHSSKYDGHE